MNKLFDFECTFKECGAHFEKLVSEKEKVKCHLCGSKAKKQLNYAGYKMDTAGGATTKPRHKGTFKRVK